MINRNTFINRFLVGIIIFVMTFALAFSLFSVESYAARKVIMGHAARGESGTKRQKAGDQNGKEVYMTPWSYTKSISSRNWTVVCRAKDPKQAAKMAEIMRDACNNKNVGYDAGPKKDTLSFLYALEDAGWDASKIKKPVETSCTPLIGACVYATGTKINTYKEAAGLYKTLKETGDFDFFTSKSYVASSSKLEVGDILLSTKKAHGAMIVSVDGSTKPSYKANTSASASNIFSSSSSKFKAGKDYQLKYALNVRTGPSTNYSIKDYQRLTEGAKPYSIDSSKGILNKGTVVTCIQSKGNWILIPSGWICGQSGSTSYLSEYKDTKAQRALDEKAKVDAKAERNKSTKATAKKTVVKKTTVKKTVAKKPVVKKTTAKKTTKVVVKKGKNYILRNHLNVRKGAGTNYAVKSKSSLTKDARIHSITNVNRAMLKKGTEVTCLKVKGDWMLIPSGWICCKPGNVSYAS